VKQHEINLHILQENEMKRFGEKLADVLKSGDVVCLTGDLGAGKTTLTKSIAAGLGINDYVTSPSYTIVNEYEGRLALYHFDVYRINDIEEMYELGYEEYFYGEGVCVIEWAGMIEELLPDNIIWIEIYQGESFEERKLLIKGPAETIETLEEVL
jgi:tRNA threonylcarbamoyladenosine biosynthesis protein TsaE